MMSEYRRMIASACCLIVAVAAAQQVERRQVGQMVLEGVPALDEALQARLMQYMDARRAGLVDIAEDGQSVLISTRFGDTNQLHLVRSPLGMRQQLTFFKEPVNAGRFIPGSGGRMIGFEKDVGGNENFQLYRFDLSRGTAEMLTDGKSRHESPVVAPSGKRVAFSGNGRNGRDMDIYVRDLTENDAPRLIWEVQGAFYAVDFSHDETRLTVLEYRSERETRLHVLDLTTGKSEPLTPAEPPQFYGGGVWSHDGRSVFVTSDRDGEFRNLFRVDVADGAWTNLSRDITWDVEEVAVDPSGKGVAYTVNDNGRSQIYLAGPDGANRRAVTGLPAGVAAGLRFNARGGVLGFTFDGGTAPPDAFTVNCADGRVTRWTQSEVGGLDTTRFVEPELISYPTFDQVNGKPRMIPALYYKGKGAGPRPVVIYCHGGPEGQTQPTFTPTFQFWAVELGISVICPNVRGSTGYGRSFHLLDNDVRREDSVRDVGALLDWIASRPELDASRVGIYGGSYGGYMVLGSLTNYPGRIRAGIDVVGIASFVSFLERTSEYRRDLRRAEYGDERKPEVRKVLESISPLSNAEKITAALFVAHGQNDPRVPVNEAQQIVEKMRALGRPVWFANALDEGHGFQKKTNRDLANALYAMFWQEHLLK